MKWVIFLIIASGVMLPVAWAIQEHDFLTGYTIGVLALFALFMFTINQLTKDK